MKKLFLLAVFCALGAGVVSCGDREYEGPLLNWNGNKVTVFDFDEAELTGTWMATGDAITGSTSDGGQMLFDRVPLMQMVNWSYTFHGDGTGLGYEQGLNYDSREPEGPPSGYLFVWSLSGNKLSLDIDPDALSVANATGIHLFGGQSEWTITELTSDRLVLYYRNLYRYKEDGYPKYKDIRHWYIFERVRE